jgi:hypothetical protein
MTMTITPKTVQPHTVVVEMDGVMGRYRSEPMPGFRVDSWLFQNSRNGDGLSDMWCTSKCWCQQQG